VEEIGIKDLKRVSDALKESSCIDFSNYAFSSFKRRIVRFQQINKIRDFDEFIERIKTDLVFTDTLIKEITVNVTEMFRDPSFWITLRDTILPRLSNQASLKIWHAACSTGEEVYSMAILLSESGLLKKAKIYATDLNTDVLKVAEKGVYPTKNQDTNTKNYEFFGGTRILADYYTVTDNNVVFDRKLTENVKFSCHNLAQDGPVSTFDLILCRNVLIYFNSELQEKVIQSFNESMSVGSFLGIGSKESIRWCKYARYFEEVSLEEKIYRKAVESNTKNLPVYSSISL
jgi:chemotaxis protein methyltransferase CheR